MGDIHIPQKIFLISAICAQNQELLQDSLLKLEKEFGQVLLTSEHFAFQHTNYYEKEMGPGLVKQYFAFTEKIDPSEIAEKKRISNDLETHFAQNGERSVNIDPGYVEVPKLVLATTKNFSHRIYLSRGIYGDVQLFWQKGAFQSNPWTYPDYKDPIALNFFTLVRNKLMSSIMEN